MSLGRVAATDRLTPGLLAPTLCGLVAFVVYWRTLLPGVGASDVADMQTVPNILGIAHPTGYPLWTLLGFFWTRLPLGNAAYRVNLLSALFLSAAVVVLVVLGIKLAVRPWLAAAAALIFGFAGQTWASAVHAEVQSLHVLLVAVLLLGWVIAEQSDGRHGVVLMFCAAGFGLAHHGLMFLAGPPLIAWFCVRHLRVMFDWRRLLLSAIAFAAPLLLYFYIPVRSAHGVTVMNDDAASQGGRGWVAVAIRGQSSGNHATQITSWWHSLGSDLQMGRHWIGWLPIALAVLGMLTLAWRDRGLLVGFVIVIAGQTYGFAMTEMKLNYLLVPLFAVTLLGGIGADRTTTWLSSMGPTAQHKLIAGALTAAFAVIPLMALCSRYSTYDQSGNHVDQVNSQRDLSALPPNAVVWAYWDVRTSLEYEHSVEGVRPDVTILDSRSVRYMGNTPTPDQIAIGASVDPALAGRPLCFIPISDPIPSSTTRTDYTLRPLVQVSRPWGYSYVSYGWMYLIVQQPVS